MALSHTEHIRNIPLPALAAVAALALALLAGGLCAKYVSEASADNAALASEFYFTSDMLTEDGQATYTLPVGTTSFSLELRNSEDDLRWSAKDISYTCAVTPSDGVAAPAVTPESGTLAADSTKATASTVNVTGLTAGTYEVSASATAPFAKTLTAKIIIPSADNSLAVKIEDSSGSPYALMTVSAKEYSGNIALSWAEGLIPDSTQSDFADVNSNSNSGAAAGSKTVSLGAYSSNTYRFFKANKTQDYSTGSALSASPAQQ